MEFSVPDKMRELLGTIRQFVQREVYPLERTGEKSFKTCCRSCGKGAIASRSWDFRPRRFQKNTAAWASASWSTPLSSEELGRCPFGHFVFNCQAPDAGNMEILMEFGTRGAEGALAAPLVRGEIRSCFSMTEPEYPGSNPVWMATTAVKDGGDYVINGHKWFTSAADGAAFAIVMAVTNPRCRSACPGAARSSCPSTRRASVAYGIYPCMGHAGEDWASHAEVGYENCRVPRENLLGEEGAGFAIAQARSWARAHPPLHALDRHLRAVLRSHVPAGRLPRAAPGDKLGSRQSVQNWIAESRAEINAARLMVLHAGWTIDTQGAKERARRSRSSSSMLPMS